MHKRGLIIKSTARRSHLHGREYKITTAININGWQIMDFCLGKDTRDVVDDRKGGTDRVWTRMKRMQRSRNGVLLYKDDK